MKSRAPGSPIKVRALFSDPSSLGAGARRFLGSPVPARLCGVSFVLAGLAGVSFSLVQGWTIYSTTMASSAGDARLYNATAVLMVLQVLTLSAGLLGLHVLLPERYRWTWWISATGALLVVVSGAVFCAGALYESLIQPSYYSSGGVLRALFLAGFFGQPAGAALVGVAALWSRGLGRWRPLPLLGALVASPLSYTLLPRLVPTGDMLVPDPREAFIEALRFVSPAALAGLCWFSLGLAAFGIRRRESVSLSRKRRATEDANLDLARRLYKEAWGTGNVVALDEISAPDLLDRRHDRRGPGGLKRAILDLRLTFPDLEFSIEEQRADGDTVTTRCRFAGTDRGGLLWYPPTNRRAEFTAAYTDRFSKGELAEHDGGTDVEDLLRQLGLARPVGSDRG